MNEQSENTANQQPVYPTYGYEGPNPQQPENSSKKRKNKKEKKGWTPLRIVALALCCAILGGCVGVGGFIFAPHMLSNMRDHSAIYVGVRDNTVLDTVTIDTNKLMTPAEVYAANVNSTVGITTSVTTNYWGFQTTSAASGSGFIISEDGYILTNYHVIQNSDSITVSLYDGTSYDATLIGYDQSNDLAVLKADAKDLSPVVIGNSDNLNVGDSVIAIGNPLGELTFSLTSGAISALDREITLSGNMKMNLIQTDCAINSGNSGGALFNLYGEVIGITNAKYSGSGGGASIDNIGFAIPINEVDEIVISIIEKGYITKPYIGVSVSNVSAEAQSYGLPEGASVVEVVEDSPASKAGIQANDIITSINETVITSSDELVDIVGLAKIGDKLELSIYRQGETISLTVIVEEKIQSALPDEQGTTGQSSQPNQQIFPEFPWGNWFGF